MNQEKIPQEVIIPVIAALALHALIPVSGPSCEEKVSAAFKYADLFMEQLRRRGLGK